jgi:hypothetical protein
MEELQADDLITVVLRRLNLARESLASMRHSTSSHWRLEAARAIVKELPKIEDLLNQFMEVENESGRRTS